MDSTENWDAEICDDGQTQAPQEAIQPLEVLPGYSIFDDYVTDVFTAMKGGIKAANNLPSGHNYKYYTCFPSFNNAKDEHIVTLLNIMQNLINTNGVTSDIKTSNIEEKFDVLLETNDMLLDRANALMDVESGTNRNPSVELIVCQTEKGNLNGSWNATVPFATTNKSTKQRNVQAIRLLAGKNVQRPQLMFKDKIDNSSKPWQPRIKDKPNSLKPLTILVKEDDNGEVYSHPYEFELDKFVPPDKQLEKREPIKYKPLDETPLIMIEKKEDIKILMNDLTNYSEIAVDLEHHSYRSFQGITCLMQISTRDTDYLIDTLSLRSELHELNEIFTKPTILKVCHGADSDIQWLQRDLSLYIVNMFDTYQAVKQLNLPYHGLGYLLKRYCNVDPNKIFQLADWRIRPLPDELIKYAREDTHYLLYIKDILQNDLIDIANGQTNILKSVYDRSTDICKIIYIKPVWSEDSCMNMYRKSKKMFNNKQLYALKELHKWRDTIARQEDDSTGYVLPNHMLLNIAEALPREMQGILACCNPIPPLVRQNLLKLHKIVLMAREQPLIKPVLENDLRNRLTQRNQFRNSEAWIYTPHDIPSGTEPRADLPCLLDHDKSSETLSFNIITKHTVTIFDSPPLSEDEDYMEDVKGKNEKKKFHFISPFERYKRVMPMIAEQEAQERENNQRKEEQKKTEEEMPHEGKDIEKEEIALSIQRVHEHFKKIVQASSEIQSEKCSVPLNQMPGKKRKRDSNIRDQERCREERDNDLSTPIPSFFTKAKQGIKKRERGRGKGRQRERESHKTSRNDEETVAVREWIKPFRQLKKADRKANQKELAEKGMLPSEQFDYKSVDFSSFQGGSFGDESNSVTFVEKLPSRKDKRKKRKKQKLSI